MSNKKLDSIEKYKIEKIIKNDFITFINGRKKNNLLSSKDIDVDIYTENFSASNIVQYNLNITHCHMLNIAITLLGNSDTTIEVTLNYLTGEILFIKVALYGEVISLYNQLNKYINTLSLRIKNKSLVLV